MMQPTLNDLFEQLFTQWSLPHLSVYVATYLGAALGILSTWFSWLTLRSKQTIQVVKVPEGLPSANDLPRYLITKATEAGDLRLANHIRMYVLAGSINSEDELQKYGIKFLDEVYVSRVPSSRADVAEIMEITH